MKIQDLGFVLLLFLFLLFIKRPRVYAGTGILFLLSAIPLFSFWVFFTAERMTMYAAVFLFISLLISIKRTSTIQ